MVWVRGTWFDRMPRERSAVVSGSAFRNRDTGGHGMKIQGMGLLVGALGLALVLVGCTPPTPPPPAETEAAVEARPVLPPEPVVNHSPSDAQPGEKIEHGEVILDPDEATQKLNAQHHGY
jgi:hypothetical protein